MIASDRPMARKITMNKTEFFTKSWCRFQFDPKLLDWVQKALPFARESVVNPANQDWLRCGGTWFAGVNVLPNAGDGSLPACQKLDCEAVDFINHALGLSEFAWDAGQVSICYPDYPQTMESESEAAFRFRRDRDAAHVDGLLPEGTDRRRHLREYHGFILGIPMVEFGSGASPFVVWEGSHEVVRQEFKQCFADISPEQWGEKDVTEIYHQARYKVFEHCRRVEIFARPGEAYLAHRLSVHGIAPWQKGAAATADGRMICYFRPEIGGPEDWLYYP